ncbi:MAG: DUF1028 domain-containing protein, partial [Acidobacteriota bacterium]
MLRRGFPTKTATTGVNVHLIDGTYELFGHYYSVPPARDTDGREVGAVREVFASILNLIEAGGSQVGALPSPGCQFPQSPSSACSFCKLLPQSAPEEETGMTTQTRGARSASGLVAALLLGPPVSAQEPVAWGPTLEFHTFSIVAVDPQTRETGVAVTTRNPCVGNAVPWVRAGIGAVATQGGTRVEYGPDLLDLLAKGVSPKEALDRLVAADPDRERRQVGVIGIDGRSAQWTGKGQYGAES